MQIKTLLQKTILIHFYFVTDFIQFQSTADIVSERTVDVDTEV